MQLEVLSGDRADAGPALRRSPFAYQLPPSVLDHRANGGTPHGQWLQPGTGRLVRQRHSVRPYTGSGRCRCIELTAGGKQPLRLPPERHERSSQTVIASLSVAGARRTAPPESASVPAVERCWHPETRPRFQPTSAVDATRLIGMSVVDGRLLTLRTRVGNGSEARPQRPLRGSATLRSSTARAAAWL